jgi:aconitate hydratase
MTQDVFNTLRDFTPSAGRSGKYHSLAALEAAGLGKVSRLPRSIRVVLEALVRHCDGRKVTEEHIRALAAWQAKGARTTEIPFIVVRIVLQDLIGFGTLNDLAAMRNAASKLGMAPGKIEPLVPVDVVVDHSVEIDVYNRPDAVQVNQEIEFKRNAERYLFVKWAQGAFKTVRVVPPGNGIIHQINMEYLSRGVWEKDGIWFPDTVFGTDSHTTMVNGIGVVAWGVGGIEAEAGMLGQPNAFLTPDVVGCHMTGRLREGVTATDLALTVTELMRKAKVVGKFVEFFGEGAANLTAADRCTVANMAPEYGATMGYFPVDERTLDYFRTTGREPEQIAAIEAYFRAQGMFGMPMAGEIDYTQVIELDLDGIVPSLSGPKRPQDRVNLPDLGRDFDRLFSAPTDRNGYARAAEDLARREPTGHGFDVGHGDVLIASITSCTNTSNPALLLAAGLLAKRAVERGLTTHPRIKTSLAPGSRVATKYLQDAGLLPFLEQLGFGVVAYGCTTCMGAAGPLDAKIEEAVVSKDLVTCAVLSGNRNFEARVHPNLRANYLASPALVVAYALAGTVRTDLTTDPLGTDRDGKPVYLKDLWPTDADVAAQLHFAANPEHFRREYSDLSGNKKLWEAIPTVEGAVYQWDPESTFIREPPFFEGVTGTPGKVSNIVGARALAILGDSITTDHISPSTKIRPGTPAGKWLEPFQENHPPAEWGHFGVRRCNHELMVRGTFANVRLRNAVAPGTEGPVTKHQPDGTQMTIFDASEQYRKSGTPLVIFGGEDYGMGSSRDWAAKGVQLLGVNAVIVKSFERIHRANLIGMGVVPLQFKPGEDVGTLKIDGTETFTIEGLEGGNVKPMQDVTMTITRADGSTQQVTLTLRIDTGIEVEYLRHGGILPYVLRELVAADAA